MPLWKIKNDSFLYAQPAKLKLKLKDLEKVHRVQRGTKLNYRNISCR